MSAVWVRRDEAARGSLPARCARRGDRCITRYPRAVGDLPGGLEWLTWTGLWPRSRRSTAPDAAAAAPTPAEVVLPLLPRAHRRALALRRVRDGSAALLVLLLVALVPLGGGLLGRAALGVLALHLVVAAVGWASTVEVRGDVTGEWVRLARVHPGFAAAVEAGTTRPRATPELPGLRPRPVPAGPAVAPGRTGQASAADG
jgi:hypothetical protein